MRKNVITGVALLMPALLILTAIMGFPLIEAVRMAFTKRSMLNLFTSEYVGLENFITTFTSPVFWIAVVNTFFISFFVVLGRVTLGLGVALLLNKGLRGQNIFRGLAIVPWLIPPAVSGTIFTWLFSTRLGIVNYVLFITHVSKDFLPWKGLAGPARFALISIFIWAGTPLVIVMLVSALQTIGKDVIEASTIDGAGAFARFKSIVYPEIRPVIVTAALINAIFVLQNIAFVFVFTEGGPGRATLTLSLHAYRTAFHENKLGMGSAIGVVWMIFLLVFAYVYLRILGKGEGQG